MCDANSNYPMGVNGSHPHFDQPDPPECPNPKCWAELKEEWRFCPMCGKRIDWAELNGEEWWT